MNTLPTYYANIHVGLRPAYGDLSAWDAYLAMQRLKEMCGQFVDGVGLCVTVTPTTYVYTSTPETNQVGNEPGAIVGLINDPRFPSTPDQIRAKATHLAAILLFAFEKKTVSVMFPDETVMITESDRQFLSDTFGGQLAQGGK